MQGPSSTAPTPAPAPIGRTGHDGAPASAAARRPLDRLRAAVATLTAAVLGAAPHVLHHVGPLAGAAILAGATGKLLFGAIGFVLAIPMLRRLRRRHGSWLVPGGVLAAMAVVFTLSSFVIGPALTGDDDGSAAKRTPTTAPAGISPAEHDAHH